MPKIEIQKNLTREQALLNLLATVALKEAAFAHLLNADGEKLQLVVALADPDSIMHNNTTTILDLNNAEQSVSDFVEIIQMAEDALQETMDGALDLADTLPPWKPPEEFKVKVEFRLLAQDTGLPLVGGRFGAIKEEADARAGRALSSYNATSQAGGWVTLELPPGQYMLRQSRSVSGYTKDLCQYTLNAFDTGEYTVQRAAGAGCAAQTWNPGSGFTQVYNAVSVDPPETNIAPPKLADIYQPAPYCLTVFFRSSNSEQPLAGAWFSLTKQGDAGFAPILRKTDGSGAIHFGTFLPGTYILSEVPPPPSGWQSMPNKTVVISEGGAPGGSLPTDPPKPLASGYITIDGSPSMKIIMNRQY